MSQDYIDGLTGLSELPTSLNCTWIEHSEQGVEAQPFEALEPGYLLGEHKEYKLVTHLGSGVMGVTWLADELDSNGGKKQSVVCKILSKELINDKKTLQNVLDVFDLTKNLNHTNICPLVNRFQDPVFSHVLVMRYAEGETLEQWFKRQPGHENGLPAETVLPILQQIASVLDSIHRQSIIHRDVKPQNIMFSTRDADAVPWLIDFEIAEAVNTSNSVGEWNIDDDDLPQNYRKSGTPIFMAPEQHCGKPQDARTDQYALAVTAFRLLTGNFPFMAETLEEIFGKKMYPQNTLAPVAPQLKETFLRALAYDPKDRFESCGEFVNALSAVSTSVPSFSSKGTAGQTAETQVPDVDTMAERLAHARLRKEQSGGRPPLFNRRNFLLGGLGATAAALGVWRMTELLDPSEDGILGTFPSGTAAGERMVKTVDGIEYAFRWCPAGSFLMGSPEDELGRDDDETQHRVTLTRGFWMLETEVTQAMWQSVMGADLSWFQGAQNPVECVSWEECDYFCKKLSSKLGLTVSLPTEAQWEYACRAGTTGVYAGDLDEMGWYYSNSGGGTHPVGQKKPNAWGLYDMHGNVWEWCQDRYDGDYYTESPTSDPCNLNSSSGSIRVDRGGGLDDGAWRCRSANRGGNTLDVRFVYLGFRPVLASPVPEE